MTNKTRMATWQQIILLLFIIPHCLSFCIDCICIILQEWTCPSIQWLRDHNHVITTVIPHCLLSFTIVFIHPSPGIHHCLSYSIVIYSQLYIFPIIFNSFFIVCNSVWFDISHSLLISFIWYSPLFVNSPCLSFSLSVILHFLSFPIVCHLPLSLFIHHLVFPIICHPELSNISHCPSVPIVGSSLQPVIPY